jgi:hypothetical protein
MNSGGLIMRHCLPYLVILALLIALPALGAGTDALTGEPVPAPLGDVQAAPTPPVARDGDLEFLAHIAEGTSKSVRLLPGDVAVWQNGALLIATDLSDPTVPVELGRFLLPAQPSDMLVMDSMLYVALRKGQGLLILDYADPANPTVVGTLDGFDLLSVAVEGDRAYCGRGSAGVLVVNLADPTAPVSMGTFDTPGSANGTDADGTILYVAMGNDGLGVYDVTDPLAPVQLATRPTAGFCTYVQERDGLAYACDADGLRIFDVGDPAAPVLQGAFGAGGSCYEMCFTPNDAVVYLAGLPGFFALSVSDPSNIVVLNAAPVDGTFSCAAGSDLALVTARYTGLHVLTGDLEPQANLTNAGFSMKLHLDGPYLYVADLSGGVRIHDLSDPEAPVFLTEVETPGNTQDAAIAGGVLYSVNSDQSGAGLVLTDVSDPAAPLPLSEFDTANQSFGLGLEGDLCLVANGFGGLRSVNVADPLAPALLGDLPFGANCTDVIPMGNVAFVVSFGGGFLSVDITDPTAMSTIQQQLWGFLNALDITDQIAWVADGQAGLRVVDIADPANLTSLSTTTIGGQPRDVVRSRAGSPYCYLADDFYGLRQMDVSDPSAPVLLGSYPSADRGMGVDAQDGLVVLAAGETGVYVYRNPAVVAIDEDDPPTPQAPLALALDAAPNPFNPRLEVSYTLPRAGWMRLDVYDARGRFVRTLLSGERPEGTGSVLWKGDDRAGRPVASGVYHLRLVTEERVTGRSVTLVR